MKTRPGPKIAFPFGVRLAIVIIVEGSVLFSFVGFTLVGGGSIDW